MTARLPKLVRMVNQVAAELEAQHPGNGAEATYDHVWHFWDPKMQADILAHADSGGAGLDAVALEAVRRLHRRGDPVPQTRATEFGPTPDGNVEADAG
jgi:formate dehydrogenase subunit delta